MRQVRMHAASAAPTPVQLLYIRVILTALHLDDATLGNCLFPPAAGTPPMMSPRHNNTHAGKSEKGHGTSR